MSALGSMLPVLLSSVAAYHGLSSGYALAQRRFASQLDTLDELPSTPADFRPTVDVIVTCLNENQDLLERCLRSIEEQDYPRDLMRVFVVDDGSANIAHLERVYTRYAGIPGWTVLRGPRNRGKRHAQSMAYGLGYGDLVLMVDSDTTIKEDGISRLVARFANPKVGSVCSNIKVLNDGVNLLTKVQTHRYDLLFNYERAAQGRFGAVLCCAGPFAMFRRSALETDIGLPEVSPRGVHLDRRTVWEHYLRQHLFLVGGINFVSGDDLHLTHLVLLAGFRSEYEPTAAAHTEVPTRLRQFRAQQQRWNRSLYRELPWTMMVLWRRNLYLLLDVAGRALLPLLLLLVLGLAAANASSASGPGGLLVAAAVVASVLVGNWACLPPEHRKPRFFSVYGALYFLILLPVKLYGLLTPLAGTWGTRKPNALRLGATALRRPLWRRVSAGEAV
jgi:N-acetylglucosaminyltransferase